MNQEMMIPILILVPACVVALSLTIRGALVASRNPSRNPISPALLLLFILPAFACSGDVPPESGSSGSVQTAVIPAEAVNVTEPSDQIAQISDIALHADGTVWVLNTTEPFFVAMSPEGEVLDYRGQRGDGPGELGGPSNLLLAGQPSQVWAFDSRARKLVRVDGPEWETEEPFLQLDSGLRGVRTISWDDTPGGELSRRWIGGSPDGFLFAHSRVQGGAFRHMWDFDVVHLALDSSATTVLSSGALLGDPVTRYGELGEIHPVPVWASCADGSMILYDPLANSVRRLDRGGRETGSHTLPPERLLNVTLERAWALIYRPMMVAMDSPDGPQTEGFPTDSAALFEMFKSEAGENILETDLLPEYKHLECGGSGETVWLQLFDVQSRGRSLGDGAEWLRIGPDGAIRRVVFPESFSPLRFTEDRIWGSHRGEFDVESVAWIEMARWQPVE